MLVKNAENYINRLKKMIIARFGNVETAITHDDDCDMHAVQISFLLNGKYSWICAYDDDVITYYVSGKGHTKEMTIEDTQVKSMYKVLDKVEGLAYETDIEETEATTPRNTIETLPPQIYNETDIDPVCMKCQVENLLPYNCNNKKVRKGNELKGHVYIDTDSVKIEPLPERNVSESHRKHLHAIMNPEWHHVSLNTLANLDFGMLDEKRQRYLTVYREMQETLTRLRKCKTLESYDNCYMSLMRRKNVMWARGEISNEMWHFIEDKLSMQNVESGIWGSYNEKATGYHKSRRYNKSRA